MQRNQADRAGPTLWQFNSDPSSPDDRTSGEEGLLSYDFVNRPTSVTNAITGITTTLYTTVGLVNAVTNANS